MVDWNKVCDVMSVVCMLSGYVLVLIIAGLCLVEIFGPKSLYKFFWLLWSILASI